MVAEHNSKMYRGKDEFVSYEGGMRLVSEGQEPVFRAADSDGGAGTDLRTMLVKPASVERPDTVDVLDQPCAGGSANLAPALIFLGALACPLVITIALLSGQGLLASVAWGFGLAAPVALTLIGATLLMPRAADCGNCGASPSRRSDSSR